MKTNKKIKNLLCYIVAIMLAIVAQIGIVKIQDRNEFPIYSANEYLVKSVPNGSFANKDSDNQPKEFTASIKNTSIDARVVDTTDTELIEKYKNIDRTSDLYDSNVLLINGEDKICNFGYTMNSAINLNKDATYMISVDVYTVNGNAYLELTNNDKVISSISGISADNWTTYYFFVKTNDVEDMDIKLGMFLRNSSGAVMFDNVIVREINNNTLKNSYLENDKISDYRYKVINNNDTLINSYPAENITWKKEVEYGKNLTTSSSILNTDGKYAYAYKITNSSETYAKFETTSFGADEYLTFTQNNTYKVDLNVKVENLTGDVKLKLVQVVDEEETGVDAEIKISNNTASSNSITNNYKNYAFYIKSSPKDVAKYKLVVEFGTSDSKSAGSVYISAIETSKITTSVYSASSSDTNAKQIDLTANIKDHSTLLKNGSFNFSEVTDYNKQYPAKVSDWEITTGESTQLYGVINTSEEEFAKIPSGYNIYNPMDLRNDQVALNNNVLMLHNVNGDTISATSSAKTGLAVNSIHKFQAMIQTHNSPATVSLVTKKDGKEIVLTSATVQEGLTWNKVELFVKVGNQPLDISIKVTLDSDKWATAFIDDVRCDYYSQPTEDEFKIAENKVDLSKLISADKHFFNSEANENVDIKIIEVESNPTGDENFYYIPDDYVIEINASLNETHHKITSNLGFKLNSGTKYKISVDVYTKNLETSNEDKENLGAQIKLTSFDETFKAIESDGIWTTYTFYINPDNTTTTYLELCLGDQDILFTGNVYFGNIQFVESVSDSEFNSVTESEFTKVLSKTIVKDEDNKEDTTTEDEEDAEVNWFYLASSMIFGLALIICVIGVALKKIRWKKHTKKSKNAYDRNKTVSKQYYMRKATTLRENKLHELEKDLETLQNERIKFEEDYKHDLTRLRELKIKRGSASEIKNLEKDMKKNQKLSANIGITINKVKAEIDYVKTDAYIAATVRKLSTQAREEDVDEIK